MNAEVKPGYKKTEVGLIPKDWFVTTLGKSFGKITTGKLDANAMSASGEYPFFTCAKEVYRINHYAFDCDALLISGNGANVGYVHHHNGKFNAYQRTYVLTDANYDIRYLKVYTEVNLQERLRVEVNAGNTPYIVKGTLSEMLIGLPFLITEQKVIASTLDEMDALIGSLDQLISKKHDIQQATMQQLLTGQRRLPGFSGEWEVKRLGDFGQCLRGVSYKGDADLLAYDTDETYRLLRSNNVQQSAIDTNELQFVNARCVSNHQILKPKDILICMANGSKDLVGKAGLFEVSDGHRYTFGAFMGCFRMKTGAEPGFIFALFGTHKYKNYIANLLAGSSINNLRPSDIEKMEFHFPSKNEQAAIATIVSDMDSELAALEARLDKARQLKQGMMQELLTGRIRLIDKEPV